MTKSNVDYLNFERLDLDAEIAKDGGVPKGEVEVEEVPVKRRCNLDGVPRNGRRSIPTVEYKPGDLEEGALFNNPSVQTRKQERYEHRVIAMLKCQGLTGVQIAEQTGLSRATVYGILALPWVKELILETLRKSGQEGVQNLLQSAALDTVQYLLDVRDDAKAQTRDRITASKELLDRTYGKPNQPITHREETDLDKLSDKELAEIVSKGGRGN